MAQKAIPYPHPTSSVPAFNPNAVLPALEQLQIMERLKQLRSWQQQQQESLLRQQQEQLARLRNEQENLRKQTGFVSSDDRASTSESVAILPPVSQPPSTVTHSTLGSPLHSTEELSVNELKHYDGLVDSSEMEHIPIGNDGNQFQYVPQPDDVRGIESCVEKGRPNLGCMEVAPELSAEDCQLESKEEEDDFDRRPNFNNEGDRPIKPGIGFGGANASFEQLIDRQLKEQDSQPVRPPSCRTRRYLKKGQGIARFGMRKFVIKHKHKPGDPSKTGRLPRAENPPKMPNKPLETLPPPVGPVPPPNKPARLRKVATISSNQGMYDNRSIPERISTPVMERWSSEDSFLIRKDQRIELEEVELREFEMLEVAAKESSFYSQCSVDPIDNPMSFRQVTTPITESPEITSPISESPLASPLAESPEFDYPHAVAASTTELRHLQCVEIISSRNKGGSTSPPSNVPSPLQENEDLDETLKPSLSTDFDFNDEEAWESFNHGSPSNQSRQQRSSAPTVLATPEKPAPWSSPVKREQLDHWGRTVFSSPVAAATLHSRNLPTPSHSTGKLSPVASVESINVVGSGHPHLLGTMPAISTAQSSAIAVIGQTKLTNLPPPSALVSKLFPALRKEKEDSRKQDFPDIKPPPAVKSISQCSSSSSIQDSGRDSMVSSVVPMNEELRRKLCQLETEIERFRAENAALERLRMQKEQEVVYLKKEVEEFERQKKDEVTRFEEYKKEEIKKLKKERKVFEAYQREAKAVRDKRDKEEIEVLRNELQELREELQRREARWSSTLARYRVKIDSLEAQNKELHGDLHVMEQERLQWWQQQMETLKSTKPDPPTGKRKKEGVQRPAVHKPVTKEKTKSTGKRNPQPLRSQELPSDSDEQNPFDIPSNQRIESPDCEIVDVVCMDLNDSVSDAGSDLSAIAEEIVTEVLGGRQGDRSTNAPPRDEISKQSTLVKEPVGRKGGKSVRFSELPAREGGHSKAGAERQSPQRELRHPDGKVESVQEDGSHLIVFPNGTRKLVSADGKTISVHFFNGDIKRIQPDQTIVYYYADSKTTHTTYLDGLEVLEFPNTQCEKHYPNGTKEIVFPDGTTKYIYPSGEEESVFPDGSIQRLHPNGNITIDFANGQRESHTKEYKRREYPDGTVKTVYQDGRQETRYSSGRVRVKDKGGNILIDRIEQTT